MGKGGRRNLPGEVPSSPATASEETLRELAQALAHPLRLPRSFQALPDLEDVGVCGGGGGQGEAQTQPCPRMGSSAELTWSESHLSTCVRVMARRGRWLGDSTSRSLGPGKGQEWARLFIYGVRAGAWKSCSG